MSENKNPVGRPSKYDPKYIDELIEYFSIPPWEWQEKQMVSAKGDVVTVMVKETNDFPTLAGFAIKIGVCRDTLHEWASVHPNFSDVYKRAKDYQENFLVVNGNRGLIPAAFGIFTLKNINNWRDRTEVEQTNKNIEINIDADDNNL